jgi:hypothetical protein
MGFGFGQKAKGIGSGQNKVDLRPWTLKACVLLHYIITMVTLKAFKGEE